MYPRKRLNFRSLIPIAAIAASSVSFLACEGCKGGGERTPVAPAFESNSPTARLYFVSDPAGALEPCGCVKDQLGGLDHLAAWIAGERTKAPHYALVSAGPLFFMDPEISADRRGQDLAKADALAKSLATLHLAVFAPGKNDFAAGPEELVKLTKASGADLLLANAEGAVPIQKNGAIREINGIKFGFIGASLFKEGLPIHEAVRGAATELKKQGAQVLVAVLATGRGEAKRVADAVPELAAIVVGSPGGRGEANTKTPPAERVGNVVIAETGNHLQTVVALDFFVKATDQKSLVFDSASIDREQKVADLTRRIDDLKKKIEAWEKDPLISKADLDARKADLTKLQAEKAGAGAAVSAAAGSYVRYEIREVRETLGSEPQIKSELASYYKTVNEQNKIAFADRKPPPVPRGQASYVGIEACTTCHEEPRKVWDGTHHAKAYKTLADQSKEFNLDCVSCHVTGYEKPGGSTVTAVSKLKDVQCEVCHGPGSLHAANPKVKPIASRPSEEVCLSCHHPPHVIEFDAKAKMSEILGPGHGL